MVNDASELVIVTTFGRPYAEFGGGGGGGRGGKNGSECFSIISRPFSRIFGSDDLTDGQTLLNRDADAKKGNGEKKRQR